LSKKKKGEKYTITQESKTLGATSMKKLSWVRGKKKKPDGIEYEQKKDEGHRKLKREYRLLK